MNVNATIALAICSALIAGCAERQATTSAAPAPTQTAGVPGPYDGSWYVDAPQAGGFGGTETSSGCEPVRIPFTVTDNKISGKLERKPYGTGRVEASPAGTPFTGTVQPDGRLNAQWQNYTATGKLSGDKAELRWSGECGARVAIGGRVSSPEASAGATRPPPFSRNFVVYFATNSAALNPESRDIVRQAATAAKDNAQTRIDLGGHTDTTGSASHNQQLSNRRAEAVRKELIADGVAPSDITMSAFGESDLAVPTANNVNEPRNRRAVIKVQQPGV